MKLGLAFVVLLLANSHGQISSSAGVMNMIDSAENYYLLLSDKVRAFICGKGDQKMETTVGKSLKFLLCGTQRIEKNSLLHDSSEIFDSDFVTIWPDNLKMGSPRKNRDFDQIDFSISRPFEIMKTEVTQIQWFRVMKDNPSYFNEEKYCEEDYTVLSTEKGEISLCPHHPVEMVSWDMVQVFIAELNNRDNLTGCDGTPDSAPGCYRLPTEAEWQFAVKADSKSRWYFGDDPNQAPYHAWYIVNSNHQTHPVGKKEKNGNGLYDVYGNVWELMINLLHPYESSNRVIRGGGWKDGRIHFTATSLYSVDPTRKFADVGFRLIKTL